jgi:hypothetical protein
MKQTSIFAFDRHTGERLKDEGMETARKAAQEPLRYARRLARLHHRARQGITADDVGEALEAHGRDSCLGPAAGSLFRGAEWQWTGQFRKSSRVSNHSRLLRIWRLVD